MKFFFTQNHIEIKLHSQIGPVFAFREGLETLFKCWAKLWWKNNFFCSLLTNIFLFQINVDVDEDIDNDDDDDDDEISEQAQPEEVVWDKN